MESIFFFFFFYFVLRKLTLLHFAHVCVNRYKLHESHRDRTSKLAAINKQLELRLHISSIVGQVNILCCVLLFNGKSPGMYHN